ncbi:MAG: hypothetical protein IAE99_08195 [Rhodothermales bacterium]|nr:hypothetical protein [Rhodothermales bacterium]
MAGTQRTLRPESQIAEPLAAGHERFVQKTDGSIVHQIGNASGEPVSVSGVGFKRSRIVWDQVGSSYTRSVPVDEIGVNATNATGIFNADRYFSVVFNTPVPDKLLAWVRVAGSWRRARLDYSYSSGLVTGITVTFEGDATAYGIKHQLDILLLS